MLPRWRVNKFSLSKAEWLEEAVRMDAIGVPKAQGRVAED